MQPQLVQQHIAAAAACNGEAEVALVGLSDSTALLGEFSAAPRQDTAQHSAWKLVTLVYTAASIPSQLLQG